MPNNWKTYKLSDLFKLRKNSLKPKDFKNQKYIGLEHISQEAFMLNGIGNAKDVSSNKYSFEKGDILYGKIRPYFQKVFQVDFTGICSTDILVLHSKNESLFSQDFLYQIAKTKDFTNRAIETSSGTKMPRADWNSMGKVELQIPPLPEQRAIASILSNIDDKIENNLAMNKTLEEMAMALYKHWFADFGPFQEGNFVESESGEIPEGWEVKELKDVAKVNQRSLKKDHSFNEINYIDISSVGTGLVENNNIIESGKAPSRAKRLLNDGAIVWSTVRPTRRSYFLALGYAENTVVSTGFAVISPVKVPYSYLYPLTCTQEFVDYLDSRSTGAAYPAVTGKVFEQARIIVPSKKSLDEYSEIVSNYYRKISANLEENQTLIAQRDALLPKLVSGEVRVKGFE